MANNAASTLRVDRRAIEFSVDLVGKVSPRADRIRKVGVESDFVAAHLVAHQKDDHMPELAQGIKIGRNRIWLAGSGSVFALRHTFSKTSAALFRQPS